MNARDIKDEWAGANELDPVLDHKLKDPTAPAPAGEGRFGPMPEPPTQAILDRAREMGGWLKWWDTFKGSTHEPEPTARAAFSAGYRAAIARAREGGGEDGR